MSRGRFITLEGGEGCGKSTQASLLAGRIRSAGFIVHSLREPGGTPLGEELRQLLKHHPAGRGMSPQAELLLMNASRAQLAREIIRPALAAGEIVVCDRFLDSTLAYQGYGRGLPLDHVRAVVEFATDGMRPDLTVLLTVPPDVARSRTRQRQSGLPVNDRFEEEEEAFFARVDTGYRELAAADPDRIRIVDASGRVPDVADQIWKLVQPLLA